MVLRSDYCLSALLLAILIDWILTEPADEALAPCSPTVFQKIEACCAMPKLLQKEHFQECVGVDTRGAKFAASGALEAFRYYNDMRGGEGGASLTAQEDMVDTEKIENEYIKISEPVWHETISVATYDCAAQVEAIDFGSVTPQPGEKECPLKPALFMTCLKWHLARQCPDAFRNPRGVCYSKLKRLNDCQPLMVINNNFPMLRAHHRTKNPRDKSQGPGKRGHKGRRKGQRRGQRRRNGKKKQQQRSTTPSTPDAEHYDERELPFKQSY